MKTFGCSAPAVGCLVKFPLGCLAFVLGFLAMLGVLFPSCVERSLRDEIASDFGDDYLGTIDVGAVDWWWTDSLVADDVVLREPDGREVARFTVRLPSRGTLFDFFWSLDGDYLPSLHFDIDAEVRVDAHGRTNVGRALARDPERPEREGMNVALSGGGLAISPSRPDEASRVDVGLRVALDVSSLTWSDERDLGFELVDATGEIDVPRDGELRITLLGGLAGHDAGRFELVWSTADRNALFDDAVALVPRVEFSGTAWPTERVERLLGLEAGALAEVGDVVSSFSARAADDGGEGLGLTIEVLSDDGRWKLDGRLVDLFPSLGPLTRAE